MLTSTPLPSQQLFSNKKFIQVLDTVERKYGSIDAIAHRLPVPASAAELKATPDNQYLSLMTKVVFQAGFSWKVIEKKWPGFEETFHQFNVAGAAYMSDQRFSELMADTRIVRNGQKIRAIQANATFILDVKEEHGSFGQFIADASSLNIIDFWEQLKRRGSRLGGASGQRFCRFSHKDTFILTNDVCSALASFGFIDTILKINSKTMQREAAAVFNELHLESGIPLCQLSMLFALSNN